MAVLKITYDSAAAITCTLTSLADAASRESSVIPNTSDLFDDVIVRVKTKGQAGGTDRVYVWVYAAVGDTIYTDGATGSDAAFTTANILNCVGLGSIRMNGANGVVAIFTGIADLFGGRMPEKWGLIFENQSGAALSATAGDHDIDYQGITYTSS